MRRQIVEVVRALGVTTFYVTHDQAEGLAVADRVALLHEGRVVQVGTPRELYRRPVDVLAAESVGEPMIGLLPARVVSADGQAGFVVGPRTLPLWRDVPPPLLDSVGREVLLGFRAEDVHDAADGEHPDAVTLRALVTDVEYTGRQQVVGLAVQAAPAIAPDAGFARTATTLHAFWAPEAAIRAGDAVRIALEGARAHVFDAGTGRALWHPD